MVTKNWLVATAVSGVMLTAPGAWAAEGFGSSGQIAISAERMFGVVAGSDTTKDDGQTAERTDSGTSVTLLSNPLGAIASNYSFARVGVDVFPIQGLSVGAALGYFTLSTSSKIEDRGTSVESDGPTIDGFVFAPRVGYAYMFMDLVGIWPRAGITYVTMSTDSTSPAGSSESSANRMALTLEVPLVIAPSPNAAILVGPTLDLGVTGGNESSTTIMGVTRTTKSDGRATDFGLQAGIAIAF